MSDNPGPRRPRWIAISNRGTVRREIDDELRFHLESRVEALMAGGYSRAQAEAQAHGEFGDLRDARDELRRIDDVRVGRQRRARWVGELARDARVALRSLVRQPGFAVTVIVTLAIAIAANSAIVGVLDRALLRSMPYANAERLVSVWETHQGSGSGLSRTSYGNLLDWRAQTRSFESIEGLDRTNAPVLLDGVSRMLPGAAVTPGFFRMLGVKAFRGRLPAPGDDAEGAPRTVVLSHDFWQRELGGDSGIVGRSLSIRGAPLTVTGILPPEFHLASIGASDFWLLVDAEAAGAESRSQRWVEVIARIRPGVAIETAQAELAGVMHRLAADWPGENSGRGVRLVPLRREILGSARGLLIALFGAVSLLLLIAVTNVAGLILARSLARARELAVRSALGAGRGRLVRQLFTEHAVVGVLGTVAGVLLAPVLAAAMSGLAPAGSLERMPFLRPDALSLRMLAYTAAVGLASVVAIGVLPALRASRLDDAAFVRAGRAGGTRRGTSLRRALVVCEVAMSVVLLVAAGLLVKSLDGLLGLDPGFSTRGVTAARVALDARYDAARSVAFFENLLERARGIPGGAAIGAVTNLPLDPGGGAPFRVEGEPEPDPAARPEAALRTVAGDYFGALAIPLIDGRQFSVTDDATAPLAVVVNQAMARRHFAGGRAVGRRIRFYGRPDTTWTVVGVVADVRVAELDAAAPPTVYTSLSQNPANRMSLVIRGSRPTAAVVMDLRRLVAELDPLIPVYQGEALAARVANSEPVFLRRFPMLLIGSFAAVSLLLAIVGLYGLVAHSVAQRQREFGIRLAVGASAGRIARTVHAEALRLAGAGITIGTGLAAAVSGLLRSLLYGVQPLDPLTYFGAALLVAAVAVAASTGPALRAARLTPARVLSTD